MGEGTVLLYCPECSTMWAHPHHVADNDAMSALEIALRLGITGEDTDAQVEEAFNLGGWATPDDIAACGWSGYAGRTACIRAHMEDRAAARQRERQ